MKNMTSQINVCFEKDKKVHEDFAKKYILESLTMSERGNSSLT